MEVKCRLTLSGLIGLLYPRTYTRAMLFSIIDNCSLKYRHKNYNSIDPIIPIDMSLPSWDILKLHWLLHSYFVSCKLVIIVMFISRPLFTASTVFNYYGGARSMRTTIKGSRVDRWSPNSLGCITEGPSSRADRSSEKI